MGSYLVQTWKRENCLDLTSENFQIHQLFQRRGIPYLQHLCSLILADCKLLNAQSIPATPTQGNNTQLYILLHNSTTVDSLTELKRAGRDTLSLSGSEAPFSCDTGGGGVKYFSSNTNSLFVMKEFNCFDRLWSFCVCNEGPQTALYSCGGVCIVCSGGRMDYVVDNTFLWSLIFLWQRAYIHVYPAKTGSDFPLIIHQLFFNALCRSC